MIIDLGYDALDEIVTASLYESYEMNFRDLVASRSRLIENPLHPSKDLIWEDINVANKLLDAIRVVLKYYTPVADAENRIDEIEKSILSEHSINRYEMMLKGLGKNSGTVF